MRISEITALRDEWYAVALVAETPPGTLERVELFGEEHVLFVASDGSAGLLPARCPHRGAHLGAAHALGDRIQCVYHGWEFDASGRCLRIPQIEPTTPIPPRAMLAAHPVVEAYGVYWTCVGTPRTAGPPRFAEAEAGWRVQVDFFEEWRTSALRIIDNNIDQSHPAFVHQGTFGDPADPRVPPYELERTARGFSARIAHRVRGVGPQMGLDDESVRFERETEVELLSPVQTRILLTYGGRSPDYCFYGSATPLDDERSMYLRISALAGDEAAQPYAMFWDFSRRVTAEDRVVLETTSPDFPVDVRLECHVQPDKTTLEYRRILGRLAAPAPLPELLDRTAADVFIS